MKLTLEDVKNRLTEFSNTIYTIPDDFNIKNEYLGGLSKPDFIKAFSEYRNIFADMYRNAAEKPFDYGFTSINKKSGDEKLHDDFSSMLMHMDKLLQLHYFIKWICDSSELADSVLIIDVPALKPLIEKYPKIKNPEKLIQRLSEHGFEFPGYSGKLSTTNSLSMTHSKNKYIINVMKSYSESKYAKAEIEFDYAHFNYKIFSAGKDENLQLTDLYVYNTLADDVKQFLVGFNASMNNHGYYYGEGPTSGLCWGVSQFAYSKAPEKKKNYVCRLYQRKDRLAVRLFLQNVDKYSGYIENAPDFIRESFINKVGLCNHCKEVCRHRKVYRIFGTEYNKCDGETFEFNNLDVASVPYYLELINLSAKSKK